LPQSYGQRLVLVKGKLPRGITCLSANKAGYSYSASLCNCLACVVLQQRRRGAAGFGELRCAHGQANISRPHQPSPSALSTCAQHLKSWSAKTTAFSRSGYTCARHHFWSPLPNFHTEFLALLRASPPFFSRVSPASRPLLRVRLRNMHAGQCGNQMGTNVWEVVCDEHGTGGVTASTAAAAMRSSAASTCLIRF
jgi:hypothetical protein